MMIFEVGQREFVDGDGKVYQQSGPYDAAAQAMG
jgi:hypothetical protein